MSLFTFVLYYAKAALGIIIEIAVVGYILVHILCLNMV